MTALPRDSVFDSSLAFLREGYCFISNRANRLDTDLFQTRLLLEKTICLRGEEAARLFYDNTLFRRQAAMPKRVQKTLLGQTGVQSLDGQRHRQRKQMFMSLMTQERIAVLVRLFNNALQARLPQWQAMPQVKLFDEMQSLLCRAVCGWCAVPLAREDDLADMTRLLGLLIDSSGGIGLRYWRGKVARRILEQRIGAVINEARTGRFPTPEGTPLHAVAHYREPDGQLLDTNTAAVELINLLRPTVAVARYITFAATALHQHPEAAERIAQREPDYLECFVQEVRRYYPFFPMVAARSCKTFEWYGYRFTQGQRVLLDLYGTNHDKRLWTEPAQFDPDRFRDWNGGAFNFVPQGGGDYHQHHRCPGEWITIELAKAAVAALVMQMRYRVPEQDLSISLRRMPTLPKSRFVIDQVVPVQQEKRQRPKQGH